jgi:hypothetical protein
MDDKDLIPVPQIVTDVKLNLDAVRRQKVRELMNLGYQDYEISRILERGIIINDSIEKIKSSVISVRNDMDYIRSEIIASDTDYSSKRAEILDKYYYLYKQAITSYMASENDKTKTTLLNSAKSILDRISEVEGVSMGKKNSLDVRVFNQQNIINAVDTLNREDLSDDERSSIAHTIGQVLAERNEAGA